MSDTVADELAPVDHIVVEFPAGRANFSGEMAAEFARLRTLEQGLPRARLWQADAYHARAQARGCS